jgi:hypothetical protein
MLHLVVLPKRCELILDIVVRVLYLISVYMYPYENIVRLFSSDFRNLPPHLFTQNPSEASSVVCATSVWNTFLFGRGNLRINLRVMYK